MRRTQNERTVFTHSLRVVENNPLKNKDLKNGSYLHRHSIPKHHTNIPLEFWVDGWNLAINDILFVVMEAL